MPDTDNPDTDSSVLLLASTAVLPTALAAEVPGTDTIEEAFRRIASVEDGRTGTASSRAVIAREISGQARFLNLAPGQPVELLDPRTPVAEVAVPYEVAGAGETTRTVRAVFADVQAYASVG